MRSACAQWIDMEIGTGRRTGMRSVYRGGVGPFAVECFVLINAIYCRIWGSHICGYKHYYLLGYKTMSIDVSEENIFLHLQGGRISRARNQLERRWLHGTQNIQLLQDRGTQKCSIRWISQFTDLSSTPQTCELGCWFSVMKILQTTGNRIVIIFCWNLALYSRACRNGIQNTTVSPRSRHTSISVALIITGMIRNKPGSGFT